MSSGLAKKLHIFYVTTFAAIKYYGENFNFIFYIKANGISMRFDCFFDFGLCDFVSSSLSVDGWIFICGLMLTVAF